ncbi:hypothetical protein [Pseudomonas phage PotUPM1]|nr:hypothetical protein [Pseudomonas phage PotUPM1]
MPTISQFKVVASLPATLAPDSVYYVRVGTGFDIYVTNSSGTILAYPSNAANPRHQCTAWVNFNGTGASIEIRDSYNVTSITDNGTGDYTVNFATAMSNTNYVVASSHGNLQGNLWVYGRIPTGKGTTTFRFRTIQVGGTGTYGDTEQNDMIFFGGR